MIDTQELRELAEAAIRRGENIGETTWYGAAELAYHLQLQHDTSDAHFIAGTDPHTILALLDRLEAAEQKLATGEPIGWMVYSVDGSSVRVTDNPADIGDCERALPLYTKVVA